MDTQILNSFITLLKKCVDKDEII